jgi:hypothetical protein
MVHVNINTSGGSPAIDYVYDRDDIRVGKIINDTDIIKYGVDKNHPS